jgi:hypothetical protein
MSRSYCKPLPYIRRLAKKIGQIRKMRPHWDIFQIVKVAQRIIK